LVKSLKAVAKNWCAKVVKVKKLKFKKLIKLNWVSNWCQQIEVDNCLLTVELDLVGGWMDGKPNLRDYIVKKSKKK
jgi:hypothetical protein